MGSEWTRTILGDITELLSGGTPAKNQANYWSGSIPWVSAKDMKQFRLSDTQDHLSADGLANGTRLVPAGTVLMLVRGMTLHKDLPICVVKEPMAFNQDIKALLAKPVVCDSYLPYLLLGYKEQLLALVDTAGHGTGRLNSDELKAFPVLLPPVREQRVIAGILGALDDKIELNRRTNETLESIARAIFRSWFVDFDPVRENMARKAGKARGQPPLPGLAAALAPAGSALPSDALDLFPDAFEDSELGPIPRGWGVKPIGDLVDVLGGGTPSTKEASYWEGGTHPFCTPKDMSALSSPVLLSTDRNITDKGVAKISSGQLPVGTVLLSSRAPIGYLAVAEIPVSINQGIIAMACDREIPNLYVLNWTAENMDRILARANGSTFLEISKRNFRPIPALVPPRVITDRFVATVRPVYERIVSSLREIQQLTELREALLPKLISGELRVSDTEAASRRVS